MESNLGIENRFAIFFNLWNNKMFMFEETNIELR